VSIFKNRRTRHGGLLLEEIPVAVPARWATWEHEPRPPIRFQLVSADDHESYVSETYSSLYVAVERFGDLALPMRPNHVAALIDETLTGVLAYSAVRTSLETVWGMEWLGCAAAFELLEACGVGHPMDRAVWETIAREHPGFAWVSGPGKAFE
jgi:hypothetical protein